VLVADDENTMLELFEETLSSDWDVWLARDGAEAERLLSSQTFDLAFLDLRMPERDGAQVVQSARAAGARLPLVIMSAHAGEERRRELLGGGADRFLAKPFLPELIEETARELTTGGTNADSTIVSKSGAMEDVLQIVDRVAKTRATVLLQGETGTGKELLAQEIHRRSGRCRRPFVRVNCAALTESLLESELFGHERGAFTGAIRQTQGLFEAAHGGTLLLDEISEISPPLQAKLLRVLQEREIRRVGSSRTVAVDARIVATTNRDLALEVRQGRFRADLFHRLNVVRIEVPALRARPEDIAPLVTTLLDRKAIEHDLPRPAVDSAATAALSAYSWPGNVRELENTLERALLLCRDRVIRVEDLALEVASAGPEASFSVGTTVKDAERALILETLHALRGNRTRAAKMLGISVRTMRNKLHEYRAQGLDLGEGIE
jgi:DNA-binding NtrC family response regulator